jgi:hypothetical protein
MKTLKLNLVALAIILGTGAAFATAGNFVAPTLYFDGSEWQPIPPGFRVICTTNPTDCTAEGSPENPTNILPGLAHLEPITP